MNKDSLFYNCQSRVQYLAPNVRPKTCVQYRGSLNNFRRYLTEQGMTSPRLSRLSFSLIEAYKRHRAKRVKPLTINTELKVLRTFFYYAIKCHCATENPAQKVPFLRVPHHTPRFLTQEEIDLLLTNANGLYPVLSTFLKTGMRKNELINLTWDDVDFTRKCIRIESKEGWATKTGNTREILVSDDLLRLLQRLPRRSEYVFLNTEGRIYGYHLNERLKRLGTRIGLPHITVHGLRHTFISHLVMSGVDLVTVKELAGHADIKTTMRYAHLAPDHLRHSVAKLPY